MRKIFTAASLFLLAACQQNTLPTANQTTRSTATVPNSAASGNTVFSNVVPSATPSNTSDKSKIKIADGTGIVTKINTELGSVGLNHDEIKGIMPAMEGMEFYVGDVKMLDNLKIGDKVDFVLEDDAGAERIINIKKSK